MGAFLRKCRGALGIGVTWGTVWAAIFAAMSLAVASVAVAKKVELGASPEQPKLLT